MLGPSVEVFYQFVLGRRLLARSDPVGRREKLKPKRRFEPIDKLGNPLEALLRPRPLCKRASSVIHRTGNEFKDLVR